MFDSEIEKKILAYCLNSTEYASKMTQENLKVHFYNNVNQNLYIIATQYFKKYNDILNLEALELLLNKKNSDEATILEYRTVYSEIKGMDIDGKLFEFYIDELKSYSIKRSVYFTLDKGIMDLEKLDGAKTLENLIQNLAPLKQLSQDIPLVERFVYENIDKRKEDYLYKKAHQEEIKGLLTGFDSLDEITNGVYPKELAMFFGRTGTGKSRVLNNIAYNLSERGEPGILFSLEMYMEQLERIFDSRGSKLSYTKIKKGILSDEEEAEYFKFLDETKQKKPPLYLVDYSANCTVAFIQSVVREIRRRHPIKWIAIDYLTLMSPEGKYNTETEKYGVIARELKQFAKSENLALYTAGQSTRESKKAKKPGTEHVSLSDQIGHSCDLLVHLYQSEEHELQNILEFTVVKYRDGESKFKFELFCNWDKNYLGNIKVVTGEESKCQTNTETNQVIPVPPQETENLF
jgi:replicative DNA helicase